MKGFLKKIIEGSRIAPPEACLQAFSDNFAEAVNVEWFRKADHYEAIFYMQHLEHIALFSFNGVLLEYKRNLPPEYLPDPIREVVRAKGEIMNAVLINKGNMLEYEFILRDRKLKRYLMLLTDMGDVKEVKVL
jgi:hypothetical protein